MIFIICPVSPQPEKLDPGVGSTVIPPPSSLFAGMVRIRASANARGFRRNVLSKTQRGGCVLGTGE